MRWRKPSKFAGLPTAFAEAKRRKKPRKLEDPIHIACYNWADLYINGITYHTPNGFFGGSEIIYIKGKAVPRAAIMWEKMRKLGARAGILDLTIIWEGADGYGRIAYAEIKSEDGDNTDGQERFMAELGGCKVPFAVCRSLDEFIDFIRSTGISVRAFPCSQAMRVVR